MCDIEMTPSKPSQETDTFEELILTPQSYGPSCKQYIRFMRDFAV